jgi:pimeloyl-ACP methyl ester carboxylesterase
MHDRLPRRYCSLKGYRVAYTVAGVGPVVLLLHGLGGTADFWQPLLPSLSQTYTVLCPDLLGFGASDKPCITYTPACHADAVAAVIRAAGVQDLHAIICHSSGGVRDAVTFCSRLYQVLR